MIGPVGKPGHLDAYGVALKNSVILVVGIVLLIWYKET